MALLVLLLAFYGMTVVRVVLVRRKTGINPVKLRADGSVYEVTGRVLKASIGTWLMISLVYAFAPGVKPWLVPIDYLETEAVHLTGVIVAGCAILWIGIAQSQMAASFRMGVDSSEKTTLIRHGLFLWSRNPIYLGLLAGLGGFFLVAPNALSFGALVAAWVGIKVQVRLEEEYLLSRHGDAYRQYLSSVGRWIGTRTG